MVELTEGSGGFLRQAAQNYLPFRDDVVVPASIARDYGLRDGSEVEGLARDAGGGRRTLVEIHKAGGMTPEEYRAKWGLQPDYPMVAPKYAEQRSEFAKKIGLGRGTGRNSARGSARK